jgi:hypothetical protein
MSNQFGFLCPECKDGDNLDILVRAWARLSEDGTDLDQSEDSSHDWDGNSRVVCCSCDWCGRVNELVKDGTEEERS